MSRNPKATKGAAGRVLIIGGRERYAGALILAGLAALRTGVDSVMIAAPEKTVRVVNSYSPDLIGTRASSAKEFIALAQHASAVLIGPGFGVGKKYATLLHNVIGNAMCPLVLDADATKQISLDKVSHALIFANQEEYGLLKQHHSLRDDEVAPRLGSNILVVKGPQDRIVMHDAEWLSRGGHPRATVIGTGDVLAGVAVALAAQTDLEHAAKASCVIAKRGAEYLGKHQHYGWIASDLIDTIPHVVSDMGLYIEKE